MELKTAWDIIRENVPEGAKVPKEYILLREEAKKWISDCCGHHRIMETMCRGCYNFIKFFNITSEELNEEKR